MNTMSQGDKFDNNTIKITDNEMNTIEGTLTMPNRETYTKGIVIFAHGSGSSRFSPRNKYVAQILNRSNVATLLVDLLMNRWSTTLLENIDLISDYLPGDLSLVQTGSHKILKAKISKLDILVPAPALQQH